MKFLFPFDMQNAVNTLYRRASVLNVEYTDKGTEVTALVDNEIAGKFAEYEIK